MADLPDIGARLELDIQNYNANIRRAIREASDFDAALDKVIASANRAEKNLSSIDADVDFKVRVDEGDVDAVARKIEGLDTTVTAKALIDDSAVVNLRDLLNKVDSQTVTPKANLSGDAVNNLGDAKKLLDNLDSTSATPKANLGGSGAADIEAVKRKVDDLDGATATPKVDVETGKANAKLDDIKKELDNLKALATIDLIINATGAIQTIQSFPLIGAIADTDRAVRNLEVTTGRVIPNAAEIISNLYTNAWGESRAEIGQNVGQVLALTNSVDTLQSDTEAVFAVAANTGQDFTEVLRTMDVMVRTGLVKNMTEAGDVITFGFTQGLNKSGDFLDTLNEYSSQFSSMGLSADQFISTLITGMQGGAFNTDKTADAIKEMQLRAFAAVEDAESREGLSFAAIGQIDEAQAFVAGELAGGEFISGLIAAVEEGLASGAITPEDVNAIFGTQAEDLTLPVLLKIDPIQLQEEVNTQMEGITAELSAVQFGDIGTAIETLRRTVETELVESLTPTIQPMIEDAIQRVGDFSAAIRDGGSIADAINIALGLDPGTFQRIESILGNIALGVLEMVAAVLDLAGHFGVGGGGEGVRGELARMQAGQLAFDLSTVSNMDDFEAAINTAVRRGVDPKVVGQVMQEAIDSAVAGGSLLQAQKLTQFAFEGQTSAGPSFVESTGMQEAVLRDVQSLAGQATQELWNSLTSGDFAGAVQQGEILGPQAEQIVRDEMTRLFENAFLEGDILGAVKLADDFQTLFDDPALQDSLQAGLDAMGASIDEFSADAVLSMAVTKEPVLTYAQTFTDVRGIVDSETGLIITDLDNVGGATVGMKDKAVPALQGTKEKFVDFANVATLEVDELNLSLDNFLNRIDAVEDINLSNTVRTAASGATQGGPSPETGHGFASGTAQAFSGIAAVHADELVMSGQDISVLNRATSSDLMSGIAGVMGAMGGFGGTVINNTYNVNTTMNTQSLAEASMGADRLATQVRGF